MPEGIRPAKAEEKPTVGEAAKDEEAAPDAQPSQALALSL